MQQLHAPPPHASSTACFSGTASQPLGWQGQLKLKFGKCNGNTEILQQYVQAPLRIQRPFYPEGLSPDGSGVCQGVVVHTAGGVVGGDRLDYDIHLDPNSQVVLTNAAASKIYRSNGPESSQTVNIQVQAGARLEWLPQETIVFNQAQYRQTMRVELEPGGQWLGWDITRLGRTARGEKFEAGNWRSRTEVWQAHHPLWIDRQWLPGCPEIWYSPHGLAGCPLVGSLVFIGTEISPELIQQLRELWSGDGDIGVTLLPQGGVLCRYRGHSRSAVHRWFIKVWQQLRILHTGKSPPIPRVWQL